MELEDLKEVLLPIALILIGVTIRFSKDKKVFGVFQKYGFWFIIGGFLMILLKIIKFYTRV